MMRDEDTIPNPIVLYSLWEVRGNELLHHHGMLSNLELFPAPQLKIDKEINDIFEFLLLGSGRPLPPSFGPSWPRTRSSTRQRARCTARHLHVGCERSGFAVVALREREIETTACTRLRLSPAALRAQVKALGRSLGPPWSQDEKLASLAAWLVLVGAEG